MALTTLSPWAVAQKIRAATLNLMVTATQELQNLATGGGLPIIYTTTAARDAAITSPVNGASCIVVGIGLMVYVGTFGSGGAWVVGTGLPAMDVQASAVQSIPNGAFTLCTSFSTTATYTVGSGMTAQTNGIQVARAGRYRVEGSCLFAANSTGVRAASIGTAAALGTAYSQMPLPASTTANGLFSITQNFAAGDTIGLWAYQTSGAALNTSIYHLYAEQVR